MKSTKTCEKILKTLIKCADINLPELNVFSFFFGRIYLRGNEKNTTFQRTFFFMQNSYNKIQTSFGFVQSGPSGQAQSFASVTRFPTNPVTDLLCQLLLSPEGSFYKGNFAEGMLKEILNQLPCHGARYSETIIVSVYNR